MRIGIDIDDTIGDFSKLLLTYAFEYDKTLRNTGIVDDKLYITRGKFDWTEEEIRIFIKKYYPLVITNMPIKSNAKEVVDNLRNEGHYICFISARGYDHYDNPYDLTYQWFEKYDLKFDKIILEADDKIRVCEQESIDVFIDDIASICDKVLKLGIKTLLFNTTYNQYYENKDIIRVNDWQEIYKHLGGSNDEGKN